MLLVLPFLISAGILADASKNTSKCSPEVVFPQSAVPRLARHVEDGKVHVVLGEFLHLKADSRRRLKSACLKRVGRADEQSQVGHYGFSKYSRWPEKTSQYRAQYCGALQVRSRR